jgi:tetratricopeptide (TPR) repeat protein
MKYPFNPARIAFAFALAMLFHAPGIAHASDAVARAKALIDTEYGDARKLEAAAVLLHEALDANPNDADAYVQAARLTIKGGHIVRSQFQPGTVEAYQELLDKALKLDPKNQKAHILKAEAFHIQGQSTQELIELGMAKQRGDSDPWLWIGYGRYYTGVKDYESAHSAYMKVKALGPGSNAEWRGAYVTALERLAWYEWRLRGPAAVRELGRLVKQERDPKDAWSLGNFAEDFLAFGMYDDAIEFSREALAVMNYGAGRLILTAALYGKAAQLIQAGKMGDAKTLTAEAARNGFNRALVFRYLPSSAPDFAQLKPILEKIVE